MKAFKSIRRCLAFALAFFSMAACENKDRVRLWVYTSSYKEILALYDEALKKEMPNIEVKWFQAGSEDVAAKLLAEISAGGAKADLIMTSDLFFYQELRRNHLLTTLPEASLKAIPAADVDAERAFVVNRFPVMVIAYNRQAVAEADRPKSFKDLSDPKFKNKVTMPSPLESGTALTTSLFLRRRFGEKYFADLRKNEVLASGGNGATLARIQSGEKPVGILLLENVLQGKEKGMDFIDFLVPLEGAIPIPSPLAVMANSKHPQEAQKLFDWLMSTTGQNILLKAKNYSVLPGMKAPDGAPEWEDLKLQAWDLATFEQWGKERQSFKDFFQNTVFK